MPELLPTAARSAAAGAPRRGVVLPVRLVLVLGVLAGLFAMHGLGSDHEMAMAASQGTAADVVSAGSAGHPRGVAGAPAVTRLTAPAPAPEAMSGMAQACVAVLSGAAVLALVLLGPLPRHRPTTDQPVRHPTSRVLPTLRPPDLSVLCILRT